jgi:hypothetical protein
MAILPDDVSAPDVDDDLDDAKRARLHAALDRSVDDINAGRARDAGDVIAELRTLRSQIEVGVASLDQGEGVVVEERDLDRYIAQLAAQKAAR